MAKTLNTESVEVIVQRLKDYVDKSNESTARFKSVDSDTIKKLLDEETYESGVIYAVY